MKQFLYLFCMITTIAHAYPPAGTFHDIAVDFQGTFSSLNFLHENNCAPTYILQEDVETTGVALSSGIFKLGENITFSPNSNATAITITDNNTLLDLNCFKLTQGNAQSGTIGIEVNPTLTTITIQNGAIQNFTNAGIKVNEGSERVRIKNNTLNNNARAVLFDGSPELPITASQMAGLTISESTTAVELHSAHDSLFSQIVALESTQAAFDVQQSFTNLFSDVTIQGIHNSTTAYGFKLENGGNNQIKNANISGLSTNSTDTLDKAIGIEIGVQEFNDIVRGNAISTISSSTTALVAGINMLYTFTALSNSGLPSQEYNENGAVNPDPGVYTTAWSPDGRYVAIGQTQLTPNGGLTANFTELGIIRILQFDGANLTEITSITDTLNGVYSIAWSPDGRYIAIGQTRLTVVNETNFTDLGIIRILQFNGTSLIEIDSITYNANGGGNPDPGVYSVAWSPDGRYLAIGQTQLNSDSLVARLNFTDLGIIRILQFNGTSLIEIDSITYNANGGGNPDPGVYSVAWSPDGRHIAIGQTELSFDSGGILEANFTELGIIRILQFNGTSLTEITSITYDANGDGNPDPGVYSVAWSPDGHYLAIGQTQLSTLLNSNQTDLGIIRILQFDGTSLTEIASITYDDGVSDPGVYSVAWSPDSHYLAIGQTQLTPNTETNQTTQGIIRILQFDGTNLTETTSITYDDGVSDPGVYSVTWSPDGQYIAIGQTQLTINSTTNFTELGFARILSGLNFSSGHIITENSLSTILGADLALTFSDTPAISSGRGIQASSGGNTITNNRVDNSNLAYTFVATDQYLQNVQNLSFNNEFPNVLSNVANNVDYQFAITRNRP